MFFLKAVLMAILPFYRTVFPEASLPQGFDYSIYAHGVVVQQRRVVVGGLEYDSIKRALHREKEGWKYDLNTYAPSRIYASASMKINCLHIGVVVNYRNGKDWVQISKMGHQDICEAK